jgi:hypothetical protein
MNPWIWLAVVTVAFFRALWLYFDREDRLNEARATNENRLQIIRGLEWEVESLRRAHTLQGDDFWKSHCDDWKDLAAQRRDLSNQWRERAIKLGHPETS